MQFLVGAMGVLLLCAPLFSQGSSGRILGVVTDQSGGVVSGATVTIIDKDRGVARTLTTDAAGEYNAPTLIPGTYTVRVEAKGFKTVERQNVVLEVGKEVRVDLTPEPGSQAQTITVTEAIPLIETTNATLGGTLDNTDINDMPLNGRNYQNLLALRPGVMVQPGGSAWSQSTNNIRPDENSWMMDGVINVSFYDDRQVGNAPSAFTDAATIVPIDAIQEFNLEENPKAEYGWKPGAIVNVGIKSGTNTLHGSAYAFGRYDAWDARNAFNPGPQSNGTCISPSGLCDKLPVQLKQFGAVVGGPIKKDKLFFMAGYEGLRSTIGNVFVFPMPATGAGLGAANSMVDAITAIQKAPGYGGLCSSTSGSTCLSQVSLNLLGCTATPAATGTYSCTGGLILNAPSTSNSYASTFPNLNTSDNGISKIDYTVNDKNRISGMLWIGFYEAFGQEHPTVNPLWGSGIYIRSWSNVENWIWTPSSTVVNEVRFGYDRLTQGFTIGDQNIIPDGSGGLCTVSGCGGKGYPLNTGVTIGGGLPNITIAGYAGGLGNPNGTRPGVTGPSPYFDFQDSLSYLRGNHALKFGGEFTHIEADQITTDFRGIQVNFNGGLTPGLTDCTISSKPASCPLEDFFAGEPNLGSVEVGNGNRKMIWWHYAGFVQDDWRIKPKLMLNLGLRYEYAQPIKEVNGLYGNFDPNSQFGIVQQGQAGVGPTLWKPNRKNFSPRVGFAWDVTGKGTTVVRGGSSVMYTTIFARAFMDNGPPNNSLGNNAEDPSAAELVRSDAAPGFTACVVGGVAQFCHAGTGTINLAQATFLPPQLGWNNSVVFPQGSLTCQGPVFVSGNPNPISPGSPCPLYGMDPNLKTPYVVNYNLGVQHSFTSNLSLDVSYVGNGGYDLLAMSDVNQCIPNADPTQCFNGLSRTYFAKFPYLQIINYQTNHAHSNYNSLQATLTKRTSHGLDFTVGYTYGHGLDNGSLNFQGLPPQNSKNQEAEYASSDFDIRHRLTVTAGYAIPGKKGYGQMLEGWKLNTIVTVEGSQPWLVFDGSSAHDFSSGGSGLGDLTDRWDFNGNTNDFRSSASSIPFCSPADPTVQVGAFSTKINATNSVSCTETSGVYGTATTVYTTINPADTGLWGKCTSHAADASVGGTLFSAGCYVKGNSVMTPPALGTFGTMGRNIFRDSGFKNVDFSVFKEFKFKERFGAEVRWELFNLFNHPNIANPYGSSNTSFLGSNAANTSSFGCGCATPDVAAGNPLVGSGSSRVMQLGLKLTF
ncbi:MAG TPA: carboxypeptidase regulatory-like domain-containing protein [Verrucomicrobiae bacterium]|nr:carboxypeptidase regulatory-like domain-containing protein [Verrucomicrobiae bacterium]